MTFKPRCRAAGWAARGRTAAAAAQLDLVASDDQREGFCTGEHSGEHGSGSAGGEMGQGELYAP